MTELFIHGDRRSGKTRASMQLLVDHCRRNDNQKCVWYAATYEFCKLGLHEFQSLYPLEIGEEGYKIIKRRPMKIIFRNGSYIELRSAQSPDYLVGEIDFLVIDEASFFPIAQIEVLRTSIALNGGARIVINSTKSWEMENQEPKE